MYFTISTLTRIYFIISAVTTMFLVLSDLFPTRVLTIQFSAGFCFNLIHILKQLRVSVKHDGAKIKFVSQPQSSRGLPGPHHHPRPLNSLSAFRSPCKFADHLAILEFKCKIHCIQSCSEGRSPENKSIPLAGLISPPCRVKKHKTHTHTHKKRSYNPQYHKQGQTAHLASLARSRSSSLIAVELRPFSTWSLSFSSKPYNLDL